MAQTTTLRQPCVNKNGPLSADVSQSVRSLSRPTWWVCYSSIFPQKNWWIGPVWTQLIWRLSNECWWGIQACSARSQLWCVSLSTGLFPPHTHTLKESPDKENWYFSARTPDVDMLKYSGKNKKKKKKNLLRCLHWRKPSSFIFCYSFIWTARHALLPDSVISPRARVKMCFRLSKTFFFFHGKKIETGFLSLPCHLVRTCWGHSTPWRSSTLMEARTTSKILLMSSWRPS